MRTFTRALTLLWVAYGLDFATSAFFIALGYGSAETNPFQRALITSPSFGTLLPWMGNQEFFIGVRVAAIAALALPAAWIERTHLSFPLVALSLVRLYGVAANVGFIITQFMGFSLASSLCFVLLSAPALALFRGELRVGMNVFRREYAGRIRAIWPEMAWGEAAES